MTIGVVLLTLGVGYMIGNKGSGGTNASAPIKVYAGGGSGSSAGASTTPSSGSGASTSSGKSKSSNASNTAGTTSKGKPKAPASGNAGEGANPGASALVTKKSAAPKSKKKRAANVTKALNSTSVNKNGKTVPSASAKYGSHCTNGTEGCSNGKLTGPDL